MDTVCEKVAPEGLCEACTPVPVQRINQEADDKFWLFLPLATGSPAYCVPMLYASLRVQKSDS